MATVQRFEDLKVWQEAKSLVKAIYLLTGKGAAGRDFGFRDQLRRAVVSVMSNIAEGFERGTKPANQFPRFRSTTRWIRAPLARKRFSKVVLNPESTSPGGQTSNSATPGQMFSICAKYSA